MLLQYYPERSCSSIMIWAWNDGCSTLHGCHEELRKQNNVTNDFKLQDMSVSLFFLECLNFWYHEIRIF
ncbi:hypothetical protein GIB67_024516, partial [Kingdonia uniflora]